MHSSSARRALGGAPGPRRGRRALGGGAGPCAGALKFSPQPPKRTPMGVRVPAVLIALAALLASATPALADTTTSTNWAGYAVHRDGVSFRTIQAGWWEPSVTCVPGQPTFSSYWIGLGGYRQKAHAIEQIGTEVDCTRAGTVRSTAWYELLPAPSTPISLPVRPGDLMAATVSVSGRRVTMTLRDLTTKRTFSKTLRATLLDLTSAEWIVEAPSDCAGGTDCQTLPLANFGSVVFVGTTAVQRHGHVGTIADSHWDSTMISLNPVGRHFVAARLGGPSIAGAVPQALTPGGGGFAVKYAVLSASGSPLALAHDVRSAPLAH